jgi:hypothetical protein
MVKEPKAKKESKYTTIIASKAAVKQISDARNKWKEEHKNFNQVGLVSFILYLLDFYYTNKEKVHTE